MDAPSDVCEWQSGKGRVRVRVRSNTPGVKIYYALNSDADALPEWAVDGGVPIKVHLQSVCSPDISLPIIFCI